MSTQADRDGDLQAAEADWTLGLRVPGSWARSRVKHLVHSMRAGDAITVDAIEETGAYPVYGANGLRGFTSRPTHRGTHVLIGRQGALCGNVHLVSGEFWASEHAIVATPASDVDQRWLAALLGAMNLGQYSTSAAQPGIGVGQIAPLHVYVPPLEEQCAIADYLDRETAQIDALVAKQEEFIGLLRERRSRAREALASRVANGQRLRWVLREVDQRAGVRAAELSLMSVSIDWGVRRRDETTDKLARAEDLSRYKVCLEGDIVVNRMRAFQGALGVAPEDGLVSPDYAVIRATSEVDPHWLAELMRTKAFVGEITLRLRGIGGTDSGNVRTPRINVADLLGIRADIPDLTTQRAECVSLITETARIDALIAKAEEHIAFAKERRSALIMAAVTGKIDVRTARRAG